MSSLKVPFLRQMLAVEEEIIFRVSAYIVSRATASIDRASTTTCSYSRLKCLIKNDKCHNSFFLLKIRIWFELWWQWLTVSLGLDNSVLDGAEEVVKRVLETTELSWKFNQELQQLLVMQCRHFWRQSDAFLNITACLFHGR